MEYFCTAGDNTWQMPDAELIQLAARELSVLGLAAPEDVEDGVVFRHTHAYLVYDPDYRERLGVIQGFLATIDNLQTTPSRNPGSDHGTFSISYPGAAERTPSMSRIETVNRRALVIGLDGATFDLIKPWIGPGRTTVMKAREANPLCTSSNT